MMCRVERMTRRARPTRVRDGAHYLARRRRGWVPQFTKSEGAIDPEMLAIARAIIGQRTGKFDPSRFRDRYQESLRELIEAKMKGLPIRPREISTPAPVIDLMAALKRSLVQEPPAANAPTARNAPRQDLIAARERCCCPCQVAERIRTSGWPNRQLWLRGVATRPDQRQTRACTSQFAAGMNTPCDLVYF
jgi:hypothetical protein